MKLRNLEIIGGIIIVLLAGIIYNGMPATEQFGSVQQGSEYKYTQISGTSVATSTAIKVTRGTLGSIVITEDQVGEVVIYDATSTAAITDGTYSTEIATFQDAQAEGVYTFDTSFNRGLMVQSANGFAFAGSWTVLWR